MDALPDCHGEAEAEREDEALNWSIYVLNLTYDQELCVI